MSPESLGWNGRYDLGRVLLEPRGDGGAVTVTALGAEGFVKSAEQSQGC